MKFLGDVWNSQKKKIPTKSFWGQVQVFMIDLIWLWRVTISGSSINMI